MPIFEYKCPDCGKIEEILQKSAKTKKVTCKTCKKPMKKQFSSFAVGINANGTSSKCMTCTDGGCPHANG